MKALSQDADSRIGSYDNSDDRDALAYNQIRTILVQRKTGAVVMIVLVIR